MKNLILTLCLSAAVSFSFAQIDVVGPAGNVGMGVINPTEKLDVSGNLKVRGNNITVGKNAGGNTAIVNVGEGRSANGGASFAFFNTPATGFNNAGFRLSLTPTGISNIVGNSGNNMQFRQISNADIFFRTNDINRMVIKKTGQVNIYGSATVNGGTAVTSDKRLKNDMKDYSRGLSDLIKLKPISYIYNGQGGTTVGRTFIGLAAQDLQKIAPELVSDHVVSINDDEGNEMDTETYLKVHDSELKFMMINAIKEQQEIIKQQSGEIKSLQTAVLDLTKTVADAQIGNSQSALIVGDKSVAKLAQNTPNPLKGSTNISYFIPEGANDAKINVLDLNGKLIKTVDITEKGFGTLNLKIKDVSSGLYAYSLIIDANTIDTKKMIIE